MQMDLSFLLESRECECLNKNDDHPFKNALQSGPKYLESDCDEQVNQSCMLFLQYSGQMDTNTVTFLTSHINPNTMQHSS